MPIKIGADITPLAQMEFAKVAYEVMETIFAVHHDLGTLFDETVYQQEVYERIPGSRIAIPITVEFAGFHKNYEADLLMASGALFELKTVETFHWRHQSQLMHYLMLMDLNHGKLVNFRSDRVQHEFVNTHLTRADRTNFVVDASRWRDIAASHRELRNWFEAALRDWGAGLDVNLYYDAVVHFFGGDEQTASMLPVMSNDRRIGFHKTRTCGPGIMFDVTSLTANACARYEEQLRRLLTHVSATAIQWINVARGKLSFVTIEAKDGQAEGMGQKYAGQKNENEDRNSE